MTQEDKELLLKDLAGRLPYNVVLNVTEPGEEKVNFNSFLTPSIYEEITSGIGHFNYVPYLRPMSRMTEEEKKELNCIGYIVPLYDGCFGVDMRAYCKNGQPHYRRFSEFSTIEDWLNAHHFDYRGLIEMGLALEAPEGMYNT